jgi:cytoskeletal protein CcmA (bactofilin family)
MSQKDYGISTGLSVSGNITTAGNLIVSGNIIANPVFNNLGSSNLTATGGSLTGITGASTTFLATNFSSANIRLSGNLTTTGNLNTTGDLNTTGNINLTGNFVQTGTTSVNGTLLVNGENVNTTRAQQLAYGILFGS